MGFPSDQVEAAMEAAGGSPDLAYSLLLGEAPWSSGAPPISSETEIPDLGLSEADVAQQRARGAIVPAEPLLLQVPELVKVAPGTLFNARVSEPVLTWARTYSYATFPPRIEKRAGAFAFRPLLGPTLSWFFCPLLYLALPEVYGSLPAVYEAAGLFFREGVVGPALVDLARAGVLAAVGWKGRVTEELKGTIAKATKKTLVDPHLAFHQPTKAQELVCGSTDTDRSRVWLILQTAVSALRVSYCETPRQVPKDGREALRHACIEGLNSEAGMGYPFTIAYEPAIPEDMTPFVRALREAVAGETAAPGGSWIATVAPSGGGGGGGGSSNRTRPAQLRPRSGP